MTFSISKTTYHKIISLVLLVITIVFFSISTASAVSPKDGLKKSATTAGLSTSGDIPTYIGAIIGGALALSGTIFLILIVYGGITYMTSAGSPEKVKKATQILLWSIIGVIVMAGAYAILTFVFGLLPGA